MRILISNDDGVYAEGINVLANKLDSFGDVTVVAPDRNCSGFSSSLTIHNPLRVEQIAPNRYAVNGTPADCVNLAINKICAEQPDIVISGINDCVNIGDDVLYSGTVAAALEGRYLNLPSIAISLDGGKHYDSAALVVVDILNKLQNNTFGLTKTKVLNVNVPNLPYEKIKGTKVTKLSRRCKKESVIMTTDPLGRDIYWLGEPPAISNQHDVDTDFYAINNNFISVTPIVSDMTACSEMKDVNLLLCESIFA